MNSTTFLFGIAMTIGLSTAACAGDPGEDLDQGNGAFSAQDTDETTFKKAQESIEAAWPKAPATSLQAVATPLLHGYVYDDLYSSVGKRLRQQVRFFRWTSPATAAYATPAFVDGKTLLVMQVPVTAADCSDLGAPGARDVIVASIYDEGAGKRLDAWHSSDPNAPESKAAITWDRTTPALEKLAETACKASAK